MFEYSYVDAIKNIYNISCFLIVLKIMTLNSRTLSKKIFLNRFHMLLNRILKTPSKPKKSHRNPVLS